MNNFFFNDICDGKDRHINEHKVCKKKTFNGHFDAYNDEVHQSVDK